MKTRLKCEIFKMTYLMCHLPVIFVVYENFHVEEFAYEGFPTFSCTRCLYLPINVHNNATAHAQEQGDKIKQII
jgi:hypothetical protein